MTDKPEDIDCDSPYLSTTVISSNTLNTPRVTEISVECVKQGLVVHYDGNGFEVVEDALNEFHLSVDGIYQISVKIDGTGFRITGNKEGEPLFDFSHHQLITEAHPVNDQDEPICPCCGGEDYETYGSILAQGVDLARCNQCGDEFTIPVD